MKAITMDVESFLLPHTRIESKGSFWECAIEKRSEALEANAYYFSHPEWANEYFTYCHRSEPFTERWKAACGSWNDKVVVDIGCGPGNLYASLGGQPALLLGVDVAPFSLRMAASLGYNTILADAHKLPFISGFADIVTLNATLHHCENMAVVLKEAARLVRPGGLLITDHDPQLSAWNFKGPAKLLWEARRYIYRFIGHSFHKSKDQQNWGLACEVHHKAGDGVSREFFIENLSPLGFDVNIYPHNHTVGKEVLQGNMGRAETRFRIGNLLSGRNPDAEESALSLMCVARKRL